LKKLLVVLNGEKSIARLIKLQKIVKLALRLAKLILSRRKNLIYDLLPAAGYSLPFPRQWA
jgi:hypothetical protein